jgi:signal peptidase
MKKAWNIIRKIIVWAIVVFSLGMMAFTIISVTTFDRADRSVFGYSAFIVLSDSMKATDFDAGDLVIIKQTDPSTLKEGDIISFQSPDESNYGEIVTHKIREVTTDDEGHPGFITYGTTTDSNDQGIVTYNLVIGKYQGHIPKVGTFFNFLKSVPGYFICIFTPFFILILVQARNSIKLFRKYKKEQMEEIQAEKKSLEEERVKSQEMMEQLMRMQQAMEKNGGQLPPEYLAQMQAAQSAKAAADASQPEPQNPAPADVTKAASQPVSHEATMPQQPIQPQHAATQQHAAPVRPERPTRPVQLQQVRPETPVQSTQYRSQQPVPQRPKPSQSAPQQARPAQRPVQPQPQSSPAPRAHDRAGFDIRTIVGEANDSEDRQK